MNIIVVTPPPAEPVTLAEAATHLRLDDLVQGNPDYAAVQSQITSAREQCEQITRRAFVQQTLRLVGPDQFVGRSWYGWLGGYAGMIELLRPPVISVSAVRFYDSANVLQTVDAGDYYLTDDLVPRVRFLDGYVAPCAYRRDDAVQVEYVAGYPPKPAGVDPVANPIDYAANVPASIKQAILLGVQLQYDELTPEKRDALERARDALLSSYRIHTF